MDQESQRPREGAGQFKFDVFISYRHAEPDAAVAGYLQRALEHYRVPREIQRKCGKKSIHRVFRDEEELGAASDLFGEIEQNLKQSEFLVVICSPRLLESKWCLREIETFIRYRGRDNILPVLIEGEPDTAFPAVLLEDGEPLAADFRGKNTREILRHARERMPRLAAPLLYCSYDELYQRHRIYKMRRLLAAAGVVAAVSLTFGAVTLMQSRQIQRQSLEIQQQNQEIQKNYQAKLENQFRYLAQTSQNLLHSGDRDAALLVALEALPAGSEDTSRPYVAEARIALENALYTYDMGKSYQLRPLKLLEQKGEPGSCIDVNEEENVLLTCDAQFHAKYRIYVWDGDTLENLCCWEETEEWTDARLVGNHSVAVLTGGSILCFDYRTKQVLWQWDCPACEHSETCNKYRSLCWSYDPVSNQILCADRYLDLHRDYFDKTTPPLSRAHMLHLIDAATGQSRDWAPAALYELPDSEDELVLQDNCLLLSPGGQWAAIGYNLGLSLSTDGTALDFFPVGEDEPCLSLSYHRPEALSRGIQKAAWVDETHLALVRLTREDVTLGQLAEPREWELECWDVETGERTLHYQDTSMCMETQIAMQKVEDEDFSLLSVTFDNVAVCLDWDTGERYSRIEDRSTLALNHIWNGSREVVVTADGYLFRTIPTDDMIPAPVYDAYHYYIGVTDIRRSAWLNGRAFLFTGSEIYCYTPAVDENCTTLEFGPSQSYLSRDSKYLLVAGSDEKIRLYDTEDFSQLWEDGCYVYYTERTAGLTDGWAAYLTGDDGTRLKLRPLDGGETRTLTLEGCLPHQVESTVRHLRLRACGGKVLVWNSDSFSYNPTSADDRQEELAHTVLWLADPDTGSLVRQWTYGELTGMLSDALDPEQVYLYPEGPMVSASGRYVLIPFLASGYGNQGTPLEGQNLSRMQLLVWDLEAGTAQALPDTLTEGLARDLTLGSFYEQDGWVSPTEDCMVLYNEDRKLLQVVDMASMEVLHDLAVDGIGSQNISFTPDGDHLIFQDSAQHLQVYNWKTGSYTMQEVSPAGGYLNCAFYQDGEVLSAGYRVNGMSSSSARLYRRTGEGVYKLETSIGSCDACDGKTAVIDDDTATRLYHTYSLDELIAKARVILDGRVLTADERRTYLID